MPPKPATTPAETEAGRSPADIEQILAEELGELVPVDEVTVDGNFFDDLGADSMVMARFCARARKRPDLPSVSMKDVYANPTIRGLASAIADEAPAPVNNIVEQASATMNVTLPTRTFTYVLCGTFQFLFFTAYALVGALIAVRGYFWISAASSFVDIYLRSAALLSAAFVVASIVPIAAKWLLIGRWNTKPIPVWGFRYYRFWLVKSLIRSSPIVLLNGRSTTSSSSPLFTYYLRALGAKVGRGVTILSKNVPVCTDLLTIGDYTVVRKDSFINCYRATGGVIRPGPVTLGKHVFIGEATVLDIHTTVEDGAQLGHASSLQPGQVVPANQHYQGAPAEPSEVDYRTTDVVGGSTRRRALYGAFQLLNAIVLAGPISVAIAILLIREVPQLNRIVNPAASGLSGLGLVANAALVSGVLFVASIVIGLLVAGIVPRFLKRFIEPGTTYPIYGIRYFIHRVIASMTNVQFFTILFGDSSYVVNYLRWIGYNLTSVEQTGSNFGTQVKHESPFLTTVGQGTVVADGLSVINADFSSTSFRLAPVAIGANNFLGNNIVYPSQGLTGDDCLLGTKVAVPVTGDVREGVGLLGSPNFEIPRSVDRDRALEIAHNEEILRPLLLTAKNRHNLVTIGMYLLVRWVLGLGLLLQVSAIFGAYQAFGAWVLAVSTVVSPTLIVGYWILVDRMVSWLQALEPDGCSIYHRNFWRHERFWKVPAFRYVQAYNGTPFKTMIWRMLGVTVGAKVFDDGAFITEKEFASIGDHCTLNAGSIIQCHSQEDGGFKSDRTSIGSACTLGVGAFVHYGVTMGDEAVLSSDSFLMKGQEIPAQTVWTGNPAQEVQR
jgi:non-ribosomal peptide synthetase-like protein